MAAANSGSVGRGRLTEEEETQASQFVLALEQERDDHIIQLYSLLDAIFAMKGPNEFCEDDADLLMALGNHNAIQDKMKAKFAILNQSMAKHDE